ncbi:DUF6639 family protein [Sulfitobacter sp. JB4-11]|uniref:DUF6639 family protein n=1 Tax=Sulfitobacter rhodophyticola TaxID=3238304 RepID=UPI003D815726
MLRRALITALVVGFAFPVLSGEQRCDGLDITVNAEHSADAESVCAASRRAAAQFARCNLPFPTDPIRIDVIEDMSPHCVAVYHCGEDWIEILAPKQMQSRRKEEGAFSSLDTGRYFQSVVVHELAHAALDSTPCPFETCIATSEYVAYAMQVLSLDAVAQSQFSEKAGLDRRVSIDELSMMVYLMAPGRFAQKAWIHFTQRDDPCGYIDQIVKGVVLLDTERF